MSGTPAIPESPCRSGLLPLLLGRNGTHRMFRLDARAFCHNVECLPVVFPCVEPGSWIMLAVLSWVREDDRAFSRVSTLLVAGRLLDEIKRGHYPICVDAFRIEDEHEVAARVTDHERCESPRLLGIS